MREFYVFYKLLGLVRAPRPCAARTHLYRFINTRPAYHSFAAPLLPPANNKYISRPGFESITAPIAASLLLSSSPYKKYYYVTRSIFALRPQYASMAHEDVLGGKILVREKSANQEICFAKNDRQSQVGKSYVNEMQPII